MFRILVIAAGAVTLAVVCFTLYHIPRGLTNVPWWDQWAMVRQYALWKRGGALWPILWSSYWGHRPVFPRLLYFADAEWFGMRAAPIVALSFLMQAAHAGVMILLARRALSSTVAFATAVVVIVNLMFSPHQMENLVWSMGILFIAVHFFATVAFVFEARGWTIAAAAMAVLSSLTMANGVIVWPVLVVEMIVLRRRVRDIILIAIAGAALIIAYVRDAAVTGVNVGAALRNPFDAIAMLGLFFGGPLSFVSKPLGAVCGLVIIGVAVYAMACTWRTQPQASAIVAFLLLSGCMIAAARFAQESFNTATVPSRYFTPIGVFWSALALLLLAAIKHRVPQAALVIVYLGVMFGNLRGQFVAAHDWADFFRGVDALGTGLMLDVEDEPLLSRLWPQPAERRELDHFLRERRLAYYQDARAAWLGRRLDEVFAIDSGVQCRGAIEAQTGARLTGWSERVSGIVFANGDGRITGTARTGFRHDYFPGLLTAPATRGPAHDEWLGYSRETPNGVYGVTGKSRVCVIAAKM